MPRARRVEPTVCKTDWGAGAEPGAKPVPHALSPRPRIGRGAWGRTALRRTQAFLIQRTWGPGCPCLSLSFPVGSSYRTDSGVWAPGPPLECCAQGGLWGARPLAELAGEMLTSVIREKEAKLRKNKAFIGRSQNCNSGSTEKCSCSCGESQGLYKKEGRGKLHDLDKEQEGGGTLLIHFTVLMRSECQLPLLTFMSNCW